MHPEIFRCAANRPRQVGRACRDGTKAGFVYLTVRADQGGYRTCSKRGDRSRPRRLPQRSSTPFDERVNGVDAVKTFARR